MTSAGGDSSPLYVFHTKKAVSFSSMAGRRTNLFCLVATILITIATTVVMGLVILSDFWERIKYSRQAVDDIIANHTIAVTTVNPADSTPPPSASVLVEELFEGRVIAVSNSSSLKTSSEEEGVVYLLVRLHAGLWSLCYDLTDAEYLELQQTYANASTFPPLPPGSTRCVSQMDKLERYTEQNPNKATRHIRLLKLCVSCSLVSMIILITCLVVFWVGLIEREVPPVLVVSVLYLLSAVFSTFSLLFARYRRRPCYLTTSPASIAADGYSAHLQCSPLLDDLVPAIYIPARSSEADWSLYLGWGGVGMCVGSAVFVYGLSKLMRSRAFHL